MAELKTKPTTQSVAGFWKTSIRLFSESSYEGRWRKWRISAWTEE